MSKLRNPRAKTFGCGEHRLSAGDAHYVTLFEWHAPESGKINPVWGFITDFDMKTAEQLHEWLGRFIAWSKEQENV